MQVADQLIVEQIQIGPMQNFAYLIGDRTTREVVVVDPAWDIVGLLGMIEERDYQLTGALLTHYHPDHCGGSFGHNTVEGVSRLLEHHSVPIYANEHEAAGVKKVTGISDTDIKKVTSGQKLKIGDVEIEFLHTPGHTPGSQCFDESVVAIGPKGRPYLCVQHVSFPGVAGLPSNDHEHSPCH